MSSITAPGIEPKSEAQRAIARISSSLRCASSRDAFSVPTDKSKAAAFSVPLNLLGGGVEEGGAETSGSDMLQPAGANNYGPVRCDSTCAELVSGIERSAQAPLEGI